MAKLKRPPLFKTTYEVTSDDVLLTVRVGEKQLGTTLVKLGQKELFRGEVKALKLGKGGALDGSTLKLKTVVSDINDMTNRTSVTIKLEGGTVKAEHTLAVEVDVNGDSAIYRAEVEFTK